MEYKKRLEIKGKIVKKTDFLKLINIMLEDKSDGRLEIRIFFDDDFQISGDNCDILESDYLTEKNAYDIEISYYSSDFKKKIIADFKNYSYSKSYISIAGEDNEWFLATCKKIEEKVNAFDKQNWMFYIFDSKYSGVISTAISSSVLVALILFLKIKDYILIFGLAFLITIIVSFLLDLMGKLYPNNAFDFNNGKKIKREKIKRTLFKIVGIILTAIVLPIIISYITE